MPSTGMIPILSSPAHPTPMCFGNKTTAVCSAVSMAGGSGKMSPDKNGGPAGFGFALALDDEDEQVAWVAPAVSAEYRVPVERALVICRSEDGGRSWQELARGLAATERL